MRSFLGVAVLVLGTGGLGWWAQGNSARQIETAIAADAAGAVGETVHPITAEVSGRDIHASGIADTPGEKAAVLARLDAVAGRRVVTEEIRVLDRVSPFALTVEKGADGLHATGHLPTERLRGALDLGPAGEGLVLASGAPGGWEDLARRGLAALAPLESGVMELVDDRLALRGVALGPDEAGAVHAALADLPEGVVDLDLTLLDDGTPAAWRLDYLAAGGATVSGKLPRGLDPQGLAAALGLSRVEGAPKLALLGEAADAGFLAALRGWLPRIEGLALDASPEGVQARVEVQEDSFADALARDLAGAGIAAEVAVVRPEGENGDLRDNAASGATERYMGGYWLELPEVAATLEGCQAAADGVLAGVAINFVTGSADLDQGAVQAINELARFMVLCAEVAGLRAEIGGHTDNQGDEVLNLNLSRLRAEAVRRELIARGVPAQALRARGYGMAQPVADNETEAGRALNRRTTIIWSE
ncbi:OmpA family protein [Pseudogemmobacter sonorensis]|uniref:OmpA family protein n=1 Tax=Pseudogemmobacter sonorensis TaxID=2989681 RepID=UPI0036B31ECF